MSSYVSLLCKFMIIKELGVEILIRNIYDKSKYAGCGVSFLGIYMPTCLSNSQLKLFTSHHEPIHPSDTDIPITLNEEASDDTFKDFN